MEKKKPSVGKIIKLALRTVVCLALILVLVVGMIGANTLLPLHARMLNSLAGGFDRSIDNSKANTTGLDLQYNKPDYTAANIGAAEDDLASRIAAEDFRINECPLSVMQSADGVLGSLVLLLNTTKQTFSTLTITTPQSRLINGTEVFGVQ